MFGGTTLKNVQTPGQIATLRCPRPVAPTTPGSTGPNDTLKRHSTLPRIGHTLAAACAGVSKSKPGRNSSHDVFLSYATENLDWAAQLAERLRNEGVRVWFDQWQIKPGDHLLKRLNDGLKQSRKTIAVWTNHYFHDDEVWTLSQGFAGNCVTYSATNVSSFR